MPLPLHNPLAPPTLEEATLLKGVALDAIEYGLHRGEPLTIFPEKFPPRLQQLQAAFATLTKREKLRGCIGNLNAEEPLVREVANNAFNAAFQDPRFSPLQWEEFDHVQLSLALLQPQEFFPVQEEEELLAQLRPGVDGLILEEGSRRATFLPSVWKSLPDPNDFLGALKEKGGWSRTYWSSDIDVYRYTADTIE